MSIEEMILYNEDIDYLTAVKLKSWLHKVILSKDSDGRYEDVIANALRRSRSNYDPAKGNMLTYLQTTIHLDILNLSSNKTVNVLDLEVDEEVTVDMSVFNNREIIAMYRVNNNTASQEDIQIVKGLVRE